MTTVERRLVAVAAIGALAALGISIVEPRAATSLLGLIFVLAAVGLTIRSLDQLVKRLPDFAGPETDHRFVPPSRELPQAIDTLRSSMAPLRSADPVPSPVVARIRELAAERIRRRFHLEIDDEGCHPHLARIVSPALFAIVTDKRRSVPMTYLPSILDELERM